MTARVLIYARYSSDLQSKASIEDQVRLCREHCQRTGWDVVGVHCDAAVSGAIRDRLGLDALRREVASRQIDIVLTESLDRIARDTEHLSGFYKFTRHHEARIVTLADGDVGDLQVGFKGIMGSLYLKDLADKTRRGQGGRILKGRSIGTAPYGYITVRKLTDSGELERGLRAVDPDEAAVVRSIFCDFDSGMSPKKIAQRLNAAHHPAPRGGVWLDTAIRGQKSRGDGILRNRIYVGRLVWNRSRNLKHPITGNRVRRENPSESVVDVDMPELRIIEDDLWNRVQERLLRNVARNASAVPARSDFSGGFHDQHPAVTRSGSQHAFWEHRRPLHLLSGKVFCGVCSSKCWPIGKDYVGCSRAKSGGCTNRRTIQRGRLERMVIDALQKQLLPPDMVDCFVAEFKSTWKTLVAEHSREAETKRRELGTLKVKISRLVDLIEQGNTSRAIGERLREYESQQAILDAEADCSRGSRLSPELPDNMADIYRLNVRTLHLAISDPDATDLLEAARALIERVEITPPPNDDDPVGVEFIGQLQDILLASGLGSRTELQASDVALLDVFTSSIKEAPGAMPLVGGRGGQSPLALLAYPSPATRRA